MTNILLCPSALLLGFISFSPTYRASQYGSQGGFGFKLLQPPQLRYVHARVSGLSVVVGHIGNAVPVTGLGDLGAGINLFQDSDDLFF
jgi:hypothetical protein